MAKFAHFEDVSPSSVFDLYTRHAEAARDIHVHAIREFTGKDDVEVDLVRRDPNVPSEEILGIMSQYSAISVSSGLTSFGQYLAEGLVEAVQNVQQRFDEGAMPAVIIAAGNQGAENDRKGVRLTQLMRNGLAVGEANQDENGLYIEAHSANKPNISSINPLDETKFHYINFSPDLRGHEDLIKGYLFQKEFMQSLEGKENLTLVELQKIAQDISNDEEAMQALDERVSAIIEDPASFHQEILLQLRDTYDFDANGYMRGIDGTSFSGPYQAGHISGAILLEEERADAGLPVLSTEEIMTLAKLSAEQVSFREGILDDEPTNMQYWQNEGGQGFTSHGGHGVFSPDKFKMLLSEAHSILETSPDIDRLALSYNIEGKALDALSVSFQMPNDGAQNLVFEKMVLTFETPELYGANAITLARGSDDPRILQPLHRDGFNWLATDRYFGEIIENGSVWQMNAKTYQNEGTIDNVSLTLFAYYEDSLMGQMIDKYGDRPEIQKTPELMDDWRNAAADVLNDPTLSVEQQVQQSDQIIYNNFNPEDVAAP